MRTVNTQNDWIQSATTVGGGSFYASSCKFTPQIYLQFFSCQKTFNTRI